MKISSTRKENFFRPYKLLERFVQMTIKENGFAIYQAKRNSRIISARQFRITLASILFGVLILTCSKTETQPDVIAQVGNRTITSDAFKRAYIPVLMYTNARDNAATRENLLNDLLGQKILAQSAEAMQLDTIAKIDHWVEPVRRNAMLRKVYETNIRDALLEPTDSELRIGFKRSNEDRHVRHLFVPNKSTADSLYLLINSGEAGFRQIAQHVFQDSLLKSNGGDLGWIHFGDLDETLEDTVYALSPGRVSKPTKSAYGWHILTVEDIRRQKLLTESDFQLFKPRLWRTILDRREFSRSREFINAFMRQADIKFDPVVAPMVFRILANRLWALRETMATDKVPEISNREIGIIQNDLAPFMNERLMTFSGESWTVHDLVSHLPFMNARLMFQNLQTATAFLIRDELLLVQAAQAGFEDDPDVQSEIQDRRDQILAQLYLQSKWDSLTISPAALKSYFNTTWEAQYLAPDSLFLEGCYFSNETQASQALIKLNDTNGLADLRSLPPEGHFKRLGWQVRGTTDYPVLYDQVLNSPIHTVKGPINSNGGWWLVEATIRHRYPLPYERVINRVEQDYRDEQWRTFRIKMVEANQDQFKTWVNFELLNELPKKEN